MALPSITLPRSREQQKDRGVYHCVLENKDDSIDLKIPKSYDFLIMIT